MHLDFRSANLLCDGDRISAILDFEEAGIDHPVGDLATAVVLLGTRFRHWGPVPPEAQATSWLDIGRSVSCHLPKRRGSGHSSCGGRCDWSPAGGDPTGWAEFADPFPNAGSRAFLAGGPTRRPVINQAMAKPASAAALSAAGRDRP